MKKWMFIIIGLLFILSTSFLFWLTYREESSDPITFKNNEGHVISGEFYERSSDKVVILAHGFFSNQKNLLHLKNALVEKNYSVLGFVFTGHGNSQGVVTLDNSRSDRLADDLRSAVDYLFSRGYADKDIYFIGHSMGGRLIMDYLMQDIQHSWGGVVLIGPEISVITNKQKSLLGLMTKPWVF